MTLSKFLMAAGASVIGLTMATSAMAVPSLQLFIEGADYEDGAENTSVPADQDTWAKLGTSSFRLWVFGDISSGNPHVQNRLRDVTFVASFANTLSPSLSFTPATTGGAGNFTDPSTPSDPDDGIGDLINTYGDSGDIPGDPITNHSPFGAPNRSAKTWNLGYFEFTDSELGNTEPSIQVEASDNWYPSLLNQMGQINVYDVLVSGLPVGAQVHFDVYGVLQEEQLTDFTSASCTRGTVQTHNNLPTGCTQGGTLTITGAVYGWFDVVNGNNLNYVTNAYSHDARWQQVGVPEPASLTLFGAGLMGLGYFSRRRKA